MSEIRIRVSTDQEAFDLVWDHFVTNRHGASFSDETGGCVAYNPSRPHLRCAVSLLTDKASLVRLTEMGYASLDGCLIGNAIIKDACVAHGIDRMLLVALQAAHDRSANLPRFRRNFARALRRIAGSFNLTVPNDSDQMPARWSVKIKRQRPTETLRQLANAVPGTEDWLRGGALA